MADDPTEWGDAPPCSHGLDVDDCAICGKPQTMADDLVVRLQEQCTDYHDMVRDLEAQLAAMTAERDTALRTFKYMDGKIIRLQTQLDAMTAERDACHAKRNGDHDMNAAAGMALVALQAQLTASEAARGTLRKAIEPIMDLVWGYENRAALREALAEPKEGAMQALADQAQALGMGYEPKEGES